MIGAFPNNYGQSFDESSIFSENECLTDIMCFVRKEEQNEFEPRNFQFSPFHSDIETQINACENIKRPKKYLIFQKHPEKIEVSIIFDFFHLKKDDIFFLIRI